MARQIIRLPEKKEGVVMRIGEFAKCFGVKKSTIRYYTDMQLLYPENTSAGFDYDDKCYEDMEDIMEYKELDFTIDDIKQIINYKRFVKVFIAEEKQDILELLAEKQDELNEELVELQGKINRIEKRSLEFLKNKDYEVTGVPVSCLEFLRCPVCENAVKITDSEVNSKGVAKGTLLCSSCGQVGKVRKGIINTRETGNIIIPRKKGKYSDQHWQEMYSLQFKIEQLLVEDQEFWDEGQVFLFNGADISLAAISLLENIDENKIFIFTDKILGNLKRLKAKLDRLQIKGNILYVCYENVLPLDNIGDRVVDLFGILMNGFYPNEKKINLCVLQGGLKVTFEYMGIVMKSHSAVKLKDSKVANMEFLEEYTIDHIYKKCGITPIDHTEIAGELSFKEYVPVPVLEDCLLSILYIRGEGG